MTPGFPSGLYLIADRKVSGKSAEEIVLPALEAGVRWIQYREKEKARKEIYQETLRLRRMTGDFGAVFIVNDHTDIAVAVEADGVHLGQEDLPLAEARRVAGEKIIGISTHSLAEAEEAVRGGADYIGFGPVFFTKTKDAGEPKGIEMLRKVRRRVSIPVVAIGGISRDTLRPVLDTGVEAVAVASAILTGDVSKNIVAFMNVIGEVTDHG